MVTGDVAATANDIAGRLRECARAMRSPTTRVVQAVRNIDANPVPQSDLLDQAVADVHSLPAGDRLGNRRGRDANDQRGRRAQLRSHRTQHLAARSMLSRSVRPSPWAVAIVVGLDAIYVLPEIRDPGPFDTAAGNWDRYPPPPAIA